MLNCFTSSTSKHTALLMKMLQGDKDRYWIWNRVILLLVNDMHDYCTTVVW